PPTTRAPIVVVGPDGQLLATDSSGNYVHPETGDVLNKDEEGKLLGPDGSPLPTDDEGRIVIPSGTEQPGQTLPTDESGKPVYPIIGSDGQLLPTDSTGAHVDAYGEPVKTDDSGKPLGPDGEPLPTDTLGRYVFTIPAEPTEMSPVPTVAEEVISVSKKCSIRNAVLDIVFAVNGDLLKSYGSHLKSVIEKFVSDSLDLSPDITRVALIEYGKSVEVPVTLGGYNEREEFNALLRSVPDYQDLGHPDVDGARAAAKQQFTTFSRAGASKIIILLTTGDDILHPEQNKFSPDDIHYVVIGPSSFRSEIEDESKHVILVDDWNTLNEQKIANFLMKMCMKNEITWPVTDEKIVPTVKSGADHTPKSLAACDEEFANAKLLVLVETSSETEDEKDELVNHIISFIHNMAGSGHPALGIVNYGSTVEVAADIGNYENAAELEDEIRDLHFIGGKPDQKLAFKTSLELFRENDDGRHAAQYIVHVHKTPLTEETERQIELLRDDQIRSVNLEQGLWDTLSNRDTYWKKQFCDEQEDDQLQVTLAGPGIDENDKPSTSPTPIYIISVIDGQLLPTDSSGAYIDNQGNRIPIDESGTPLGSDGQPLPTDNSGRYVFTEPTIPTETPTRPPIVVVGPDGQPLPTSDTGEILHPKTGEALSTTSTGEMLGPDGSPLPTDAEGNVILISDTEQPAQTLPT
ncbi:hypothetical protein FO519_009600, partial [Halicephalobus sp. NKZ332]